MYSAIENVRDNILQKELPIFFFDTCSILDIINSLHLHSLPEQYASSAFDLMKLHGDKVWLITCQNVCEEWGDNIGPVLSTMDKEISRTDRNISSMLTITNLVLNASYAMPQRVSSLKISEHVKSLSEQFLNTCLHLERKDQHTLRAMQRVRKDEAPARKGKPEPKDCEIVECFFDLCALLRDGGFDEKIIFVTANKEDFGSPKQLKPPLDSQFGKFNADLVSNINHVLAVARGQA